MLKKKHFAYEMGRRPVSPILWEQDFVLSEGGFICFASTDSHRPLDWNDEDLAVADSSCLRCGGERIDGLIDLIGWQDNLDFEFRNEVYGILGAPVDFRVAFLPAATSNFGYCHALQAKLGEGSSRVIQLEWLDDGHHQLHLATPFCDVLGFSDVCALRTNQVTCQLRQLLDSEPRFGCPNSRPASATAKAACFSGNPLNAPI